VSLSPKLRTIIDELKARYPEGLSLNQLADELVHRPVSFADVEVIIDGLEDDGVSLDLPDPVARPEDLMRVLATARELAQELGRRPSVEEIATRAALSADDVRRALLLSRMTSLS
jgi:hypothetical protein